MRHCPISLLIPRCPRFVGQSEACTISMWGLCLPLFMQWRLSNLVSGCIPEWKAASPDEPAFHSNIHEFIALSINDFFMMMPFTNLHYQCSPILTNLDGWIFLLEADNTSALIWVSRLSRMQEYHIVKLCYLLSHIEFYLNTMFPSRFYGQHIAGILNV